MEASERASEPREERRAHSWARPGLFNSVTLLPTSVRNNGFRAHRHFVSHALRSRDRPLTSTPSTTRSIARLDLSSPPASSSLSLSISPLWTGLCSCSWAPQLCIYPCETLHGSARVTCARLRLPEQGIQLCEGSHGAEDLARQAVLLSLAVAHSKGSGNVRGIRPAAQARRRRFTTALARRSRCASGSADSPVQNWPLLLCAPSLSTPCIFAKL